MNDKSSYQIFNESGVSVPVDKAGLKTVIGHLEEGESCRFHLVEVVYVDNDEILRINNTYLGHDYVTDIITFPYEESNEQIEGTLFCCATQIRQQSIEYGVTYENETLRVLIHGLLHLVGYDDQNEADRTTMRNRENKYLRLYRDS